MSSHTLSRVEILRAHLRHKGLALCAVYDDRLPSIEELEGQTAFDALQEIVELIDDVFDAETTDVIPVETIDHLRALSRDV